jgi:hypothetical protein
VAQARLEDGVPVTGGWFVVNARDAPWMHNDMRSVCRFGGEGEERELATWDLFHCPPRTPHTIVGAGDEPALVLAVGARVERGSARYPVDATAVRHGAGVETESETPYARYSEPQRGPAPDFF